MNGQLGAGNEAMKAKGRAPRDNESFATGGGRGARLARVAGLLAALLLTSSPGPTRAEADWISERAASLLARAIRIPSVNPPGNEGPLAELVAAELAGEGIEARTIELGGEGEGRRAAVFARLPGRAGGARPLILLSHLDVVPARASEWQRDPFGGQIEDGWVYGRGALDAKGVTVIQALTLVALSRRNEPLDRDIIVLATPDEEAGGNSGAGAIVRDHPQLLADAEYLLTEGGGIRSADAHGQPPVWGVSVTEKSPCWLELRARGRAGHGATPRADAAVPRLIAALDRVRRIRSPLHVLAEVEQMFRALAPSAAAPDRAGFHSLATALAEDSNFRRRFLSDPAHDALVRNTVSITMLEGSQRVNVVPATARARLDVRLLPGERCHDFVSHLRELLPDPELEIETLLSFSSRSSPSDTALFAAIERVARRVEPEAIVVPRMISGFTDAHWFRQRGIVAYGFVPRWLTPAEAHGVHGSDERISIENLRAGVETLGAIIEELAAPDHRRGT